MRSMRSSKRLWLSPRIQQVLSFRSSISYTQIHTYPRLYRAYYMFLTFAELNSRLYYTYISRAHTCNIFHPEATTFAFFFFLFTYTMFVHYSHSCILSTRAMRYHVSSIRLFRILRASHANISSLFFFIFFFLPFHVHFHSCEQVAILSAYFVYIIPSASIL